jgi:hypothetical protein
MTSFLLSVAQTKRLNPIELFWRQLSKREWPGNRLLPARQNISVGEFLEGIRFRKHRYYTSRFGCFFCHHYLRGNCSVAESGKSRESAAEGITFLVELGTMLPYSSRDADRPFWSA